MKEIRYEAPTTLDEACRLLAGAEGGGRVLAGGTDLLVQMRAGMVAPGLIVDVKKIPEMMTIAESGGGFRVGAAVSAAAIGEHAAVPRACAGVVKPINVLGSNQVQGRASAGGNLCNASPAADSVPAMIAAGAVLSIHGPGGRRELPVEKLQAGPGKTS